MMAPRDSILVINAGSSSIKFCVFAMQARGALGAGARGQVEGIGGSKARLHLRQATDAKVVTRDLGGVADHRAAMESVRMALAALPDGDRIVAVGHRVVHGGVDHLKPVRIDARVLAELEALAALAPLHQPHNLAAIRAIAADAPSLPQVACFDTAFHRGHPVVADLYALPYRLYEDGVRRYGFHGLSYEYIAGVLPDVAPEIAGGRVVVGHLGNGVSLCALHRGRSIDSTMGFTALDGLPMGTRTGAIDPGVLLYLLQEKGLTPDQLAGLLYHDSGLLGISGLSNDMRELLASPAPRAQLAVDYFVYRVVREVGALAAALGGLDALVFTAGIGENSAEIRARVCGALGWLGVEIDPEANRNSALRMSAASSRVTVLRIPTDEELMIARHTRTLLAPAAGA